MRTHQIPEFIYHESLSADEVEAWLHQGEELGASWQKLFVRVRITFCAFLQSFYFLTLRNVMKLMYDVAVTLIYFCFSPSGFIKEAKESYPIAPTQSCFIKNRI